MNQRLFQSRGIRSDNAVGCIDIMASSRGHCFNPVESGLIMLSPLEEEMALIEKMFQSRGIRSDNAVNRRNAEATWKQEFQSRGIRSDNAV